MEIYMIEPEEIVDINHYFFEEKKFLADEKIRTRNEAIIRGLYFWDETFKWFVFFLTPEFIWSEFMEIK
jgi:hypothetical protein